MKKIFLLLSIVSVFGLTSCNNDDDVDYDTYPEVFDTPPVTFSPNNGRYEAIVPLNPNILSTDVVTVYRRTVDNGTTVWEPIPTTLYIPNVNNPNVDLEVDYNFNFTTTDVLLYMQATLDLATTPQYTQNQIFRIVLIPGYVAKNLDTNNYNAVMSAIKEANNGTPVQIKTIKQ